VPCTYRYRRGLRRSSHLADASASPAAYAMVEGAGGLPIHPVIRLLPSSLRAAPRISHCLWRGLRFAEVQCR
jgi:hypothetical protein